MVTDHESLFVFNSVQLDIVMICKFGVIETFM